MLWFPRIFGPVVVVILATIATVAVKDPEVSDFLAVVDYPLAGLWTVITVKSWLA